MTEHSAGSKGKNAQKDSAKNTTMRNHYGIHGIKMLFAGGWQGWIHRFTVINRLNKSNICRPASNLLPQKSSGFVLGYSNIAAANTYLIFA